MFAEQVTLDSKVQRNLDSKTSGKKRHGLAIQTFPSPQEAKQTYGITTLTSYTQLQLSTT